jgi:hypothetical protein
MYTCFVQSKWCSECCNPLETFVTCIIYIYVLYVLYVDCFNHVISMGD